MIQFVKAGQSIIPLGDIKRVDITHLEQNRVTIYTLDQGIYEATGFDAIEAVMLTKPSAVEGRRLKWRKHAWMFHNLVGHPIMEIMTWFGFKKAAIRFHDYTTPTPR